MCAHILQTILHPHLRMCQKKKTSTGLLISGGMWRVLACRKLQLLAQQMLKPKKLQNVQKQIA